MARPCFLMVSLAIAMVCSGSMGDGDTEFPSLLSALGSKMALADDYYDDNGDYLYDDEAPAKPCCFPDTWQGRIVSEVGLASRRGAMMSRAIDRIYVDGSRKRVAGNKLEFHSDAVDEDDDHPRSINVSYILNVNSNSSADLYLFDRQVMKCKHRSLRRIVWRRQCIPANATLRGQFSLGPATRGLSVQSWTFGAGGRRAADIVGDKRPTPRPRVSFSANVVVTPTCIPVIIQEHGSIQRGIDQMDDSEGGSQQQVPDDVNEVEYYDDSVIGIQFPPRTTTTTSRPHPHPGPRPRPGRGAAFESSYYFTGVQPRITDPSVFTVPSYCKKDDTLRFGDSSSQQQMPTILERFIVL